MVEKKFYFYFTKYMKGKNEIAFTKPLQCKQDLTRSILKWSKANMNLVFLLDSLLYQSWRIQSALFTGERTNRFMAFPSV